MIRAHETMGDSVRCDIPALEELGNEQRWFNSVAQSLLFKGFLQLIVIITMHKLMDLPW